MRIGNAGWCHNRCQALTSPSTLRRVKLASGPWRLQEPAGLENQPASAGLCSFWYHYRAQGQSLHWCPHPALKYHAEAQATDRQAAWHQTCTNLFSSLKDFLKQSNTDGEHQAMLGEGSEAACLCRGPLLSSAKQKNNALWPQPMLHNFLPDGVLQAPSPALCSPPTPGAATSILPGAGRVHEMLQCLQEHGAL